MIEDWIHIIEIYKPHIEYYENYLKIWGIHKKEHTELIINGENNNLSMYYFTKINKKIYLLTYFEFELDIINDNIKIKFKINEIVEEI